MRPKITKADNGTYTVPNLPGTYADEKAARNAHKIPTDRLALIARAYGTITYRHLLEERLRSPLTGKIEIGNGRVAVDGKDPLSGEAVSIPGSAFSMGHVANLMLAGNTLGDWHIPKDLPSGELPPGAAVGNARNTVFRGSAFVPARRASATSDPVVIATREDRDA